MFINAGKLIMTHLFKQSACLAVLAAFMATSSVHAQTYEDDTVYGYVGPSDVEIIYQPEAASYRPTSNVDNGDEGKRFSVVCAISLAGRLNTCYAEPNDINDQNFVRVAIENARKWVVGPQLRDGTPSADQAFRFVCRLDRIDGNATAPQVASTQDAGISDSLSDSVN